MKKIFFILFCLPLIVSAQWMRPNWAGQDYFQTYIIGWGDNSTVAYLTIEYFEDGDYEIGKSELSLLVQDTRSDKIIYNNLLDTFSFITELDDSTIFSRHRNIIHSIKKKYNISENNSVFYTIENLNNYTFVFDSISEINWETNNPDYGNRNISYRLYILDKFRKRKQISSGKFISIPEIRIYGYFKSPIENRILILIGGSELIDGIGVLEYNYLEHIGCSLNPSTFK